jgi:hypothetical protein
VVCTGGFPHSGRFGKSEGAFDETVIVAMIVFVIVRVVSDGKGEGHSLWGSDLYAGRCG